MRAGRMRHRLKLLSRSVTRDSIGGEVITWVEQDEVFAEAVPIEGREYFSALRVDSEVTVRFRIRYRTDVTSAWRVEWRQQQYDVIDVIDERALGRDVSLMCKSVALNG